MLGVPWLHSSKTTYQLAVLWLYSNLHPKHRLRHPNVLGLRRGQSQDHWNSSKFTPWPLRHGAAEQCCFKCSRVPFPSKKCISTSWRMGWQSNGRCGDLIFAKCWRCNHGCCQFGISKEVLKNSASSTLMCSTSSWCPHISDLKANLIILSFTECAPEVTAASLWCLSTWRNTKFKLLDLLVISLES